MSNNKDFIYGRGAQLNVHNRFDAHDHEFRDDFLNHCATEGDEVQNSKTVLIDTFPKTIVNKVNSPDVGMGFSLNPYQGCEHGCIYCYARNSHEYWGYSAGLDFEQKILVKKNAVELLQKKISSKNALVQRDIDILKDLAADNLVQVSLSVTSLEEETRRILEPRTASIKKRLETIEKLSVAGIPVNVMMAPIIPSINSHEIMPLVKEVAERGALGVGYTIVRLNGAIGGIFTDWIRKAMPDRADKVLHQIENVHGGSLNDSRFGTRMKGEGEFASQVAQQFKIAKAKYLKERERPVLNCDLHEQYKDGQMKLF